MNDQGGGQREFARNILFGDDCRRLLAAAEDAEEGGRGGVREAGMWEVLPGFFPTLPVLSFISPPCFQLRGWHRVCDPPPASIDRGSAGMPRERSACSSRSCSISQRTSVCSSTARTRRGCSGITNTTSTRMSSERIPPLNTIRVAFSFVPFRLCVLLSFLLSPHSCWLGRVCSTFPTALAQQRQRRE